MLKKLRALVHAHHINKELLVALTDSVIVMESEPFPTKELASATMQASKVLQKYQIELYDHLQKKKRPSFA